MGKLEGENEELSWSVVGFKQVKRKHNELQILMEEKARLEWDKEGGGHAAGYVEVHRKQDQWQREERMMELENEVETGTERRQGEEEFEGEGARVGGFQGKD